MIEKIDMRDKLGLSVEDLSKTLGIGLDKAYELVHRQDFPTLFLGRRIIIPITELEKWLAEQTKAKL